MSKDKLTEEEKEKQKAERERLFQEKMKELKKRDPFIYKNY